MAGLTLGENVQSLADRLELDGSMPMWNRPYVSRANILPVEGYESGYVTYGNCKRKGTILRFKLNYKDTSEDFFNKVKSAIQKRYGGHDEWRGNAFGTLKVWKWRVDGSGKRPSTSVIIMRYVGDDGDFTEGNSIRLSFPDWLKEERECWKARQTHKEVPPLPAQRTGFEWMLPH